MSVDTVRNSVDDLDQQEVLATIESGAKEHGDLTLANDAHYQLRVLESRRESPPVHVLDYVFYRAIAGYFVRPLNPLLVLLVLAMSMSVLRTARQRPEPGRPSAAPVVTRPGFRGSQSLPAASAPDPPVRLRLLRRAGRRIAGALHTFGDEALDTLSLIGRQRNEAGGRSARRIEALIYRLLLVVVLIGFANSNPTLRQMFDALR